MVDEDFVMGYVCGYNDGGGTGGTIISKTITQNGTYHAADDNADGYDPVIVKVKLSQKEIDDLIQWVIDQIEPQLPDGTEITPPTVDADNEFEPSVDGAEYPYLVGVSSDGKYSQVMYGVEVFDVTPTMRYYVDLYVNGQLARHDAVLSVPSYNQAPGNTAHLQSDGSVKVTQHWDDGIHDPVTKIWGPYINAAYTTVWAI